MGPGPGIGADATRYRRRRGERGFPGGSGAGDRHSAGAIPERPQLFLRRAARADGRAHSRPASGVAGGFRAPAAAGPAARAGCRAVHHDRHGWPRHTDVHQQRGARRGRNASPSGGKLALGSVLLLFVADLLQLQPAVVAAIAAIGAIAHAVRLFLWRPWRTLAAPLVWILHAAYAWIVVHLALRALSGMAWLGESFAIHALTVGAIGGLTLGMMTRTARGHTARPLVADGYELACFALVQIAAVVRVFGGMVSPGLYLPSIQFRALWCAAFGLYASVTAGASGRGWTEGRMNRRKARSAGKGVNAPLGSEEPMAKSKSITAGSASVRADRSSAACVGICEDSRTEFVTLGHDAVLAQRRSREGGRALLRWCAARMHDAAEGDGSGLPRAAGARDQT